MFKLPENAQSEYSANLIKVEDIINIVSNRLGDPKFQRWRREQYLYYIDTAYQDINMDTDAVLTTFQYSIQLPEKDEMFDTLWWRIIPPLNFFKIVDIEVTLLPILQPEQNPSVITNADEIIGKYPVYKHIPVESKQSMREKEAEYPCVVLDHTHYNTMYFYLDDPMNASNWNIEILKGKLNLEDIEAGQSICLLFTVVDGSRGRYFWGNNEPQEYIGLTENWLQAIVHYVAGMLLQDDNDANNIQRGELELNKYRYMKTRLYKLATKDYTSNMYNKLHLPKRRYE